MSTWETALAKVFGRHHRRYGTRQLQAAVRQKGYRVGRQRLRAAMRRQGLYALQPLMHSERGGQYCGNAYRKLLHDH